MLNNATTDTSAGAGASARAQKNIAFRFFS
jgi:hypothetical protein